MLKIKNNFEKIYIFSLILFIVSIIFQNDFVIDNILPNYIYSITRYIVTFLCLIKVITCDLKNYNQKTNIILLVVFAVICISSLKSGNRVMLQLLPISLASAGLNYNRIFKWYFICISVLLIFIISLSLIGLIPNLAFCRGYSNISRYALGFNYTTFVSIMIFSLTLTYLYIKRNKLNFFDIIFLFFINICAYIATNSRAELVCSFVSILLFIFYKLLYQKKINKILNLLTKYLMIILVVVSIAIPLMYNNKNMFFKKSDDILSRRLYYWNDAISDHNISLFGNKVEYYRISNSNYQTNNKTYIIDNSYLDILISSGVLMLLIITFAFYYLSLYSIREKNIYLQIILIIIYIHSFINPDLLMIKYNIFLIMLFGLLPKKNTDNNLLIHKMNIKELHKIQTEMLRKLTRFLEKNKLNYYLCGGTLLGAIRHHGFIPWDDDVDILMPRDDYEKLIILSKNKPISNKLYVSSFKNNNSDLPFIKVYNTEYIVEETYIEVKDGEYLWIDIFPMDGLFEEQSKNIKLYKKIAFYRKLLTIRMLKSEMVVKSSKNIFKLFFKPILKFFIDLLPVKYYSKKIDKISKKCPFKDSKYVGGVMWGYGPQELLEKKKVLKKVRVEFEGMKLYTFSCWDEYLKNLYGNYMKLPPKEQQTTHLVSIVKVDNYE